MVQTTASLSIVLSLLLGCGDSDSKPTDSDASGGGEHTEDVCQTLCAQTPSASESEAACAMATLSDLGEYDLGNVTSCMALVASFQQGAATEEQCIACYTDAGVEVDHCSTVQAECF